MRVAPSPGHWSIPVANVTLLVTLDKDYLREKVGRVPPKMMARVEDGVRLALGL